MDMTMELLGGGWGGWVGMDGRCVRGGCGKKQGRGNVTVRVTPRVEDTSSAIYSDSAHFVSYFPSFSNTSSLAVPWLYR